MAHTLEGKLKAISQVSIALEKYSRKDVKGEVKISTKLIIDYKGEERTIDFPGLVFADSIGHKIKYTMEELSVLNTCYSPVNVGQIHSLLDVEINRMYTGKVSYSS